MDESLFRRLADWLLAQPVVLASVISTRGATPRKRGSRMLISADAIAGSVGGGQAEVRVIEQARTLIASHGHAATLAIGLDGRADSAGVCGGDMSISLRCWAGADDQARAARISATLAQGRSFELEADDLGSAGVRELAVADTRLLIFGAGHCGAALCELAAALDYDRHVFDTRADCLQAPAFKGARTYCGDIHGLRSVLETDREVQAVLLNRDYHADVAALEILCERPPRFIGMMGSRRRVGEVLAALGPSRQSLTHLVAPVGIDIDAQTPHEIAISILAQLIQHRRQY